MPHFCKILSIFFSTVCLISCKKDFETSFQINDVSKTQLIKIPVDKKYKGYHFFSKISGNLDGDAILSRGYVCSKYATLKECNPDSGNIIGFHYLKKGQVMIGDTDVFISEDILLRYRPISTQKGNLKVEIRIPNEKWF